MNGLDHVIILYIISLTLSSIFTSASYDISKRTTLVCALRAAKCRGVQPD